MFRKIIHAFSEYRLYLLFFALVLLFIFISGFNGLYGQDSYEYLRFTNALVEFAKHRTNPGVNYWPLLYPIFGIIFSLVFKPVFALQLISLLSLVVSGFYLEKNLKILYKEDKPLTRFFVFTFFLLSPYLLRISITVMSDSLCLAFITTAYYFFLRYLEEKKNSFFVFFTLLSTCAIATRYAAFLTIMPLAGYILYSFVKKFNLKSLLYACLAIFIVVLPYIIIHKTSSVGIINLWLSSWSIQNFFHSSFNAADGQEVYMFPNIVFCIFNLFHPAYCFLGILFLITGFRLSIKRISPIILRVTLFSLSIYAFFLAGMPFQDLRHLILSFPFVIVVLFPGYTKIYFILKTKYPYLIRPIALLCIIIQLALFVRVFIPFYHYNKIEKQISTVVIKYNAKTLYTFSIDAAVCHYGFTGEIINLREVRLETMPIKKDSSLVLFNEKLFGSVWKNKPPMLNWAYLEANCRLEKLEDLPDDWKLYAIKK